MAISLLDHGWILQTQPGTLYLECADNKLDPGAVLSEMKSKKLSAQEWESNCVQRGMGDWPLASLLSSEPAPSLLAN
jgi:hypothetical protein